MEFRVIGLNNMIVISGNLSCCCILYTAIYHSFEKLAVLLSWNSSFFVLGEHQMHGFLQLKAEEDPRALNERRAFSHSISSSCSCVLEDEK